MNAKCRFSESGFTLVEVIVTIGIWGVVILSLISVQKSLIERKTSGASSYEYASLISEISAILSTEQGCRTALGGPVTRGGTPNPSRIQTFSNLGGIGQLGGTAAYPSPAPSPLLLYQPFMDPETTSTLLLGAPPAQMRRIREWEVSELQLTTLVPLPASGSFPNNKPARFPAQLDIRLNRLSQGGGVDRHIRGIINLSLEVDTNGAIISCGPFSYATASTFGCDINSVLTTIDGPGGGTRPICIPYRCAPPTTRTGTDPITGGVTCW